MAASSIFPFGHMAGLLKPGVKSKVASCQSVPSPCVPPPPTSHECCAALAQAPVSHSARMTNCPLNGLLASARFPSSRKWAVFNIRLLSHRACEAFPCASHMCLLGTAAAVAGLDSRGCLYSKMDALSVPPPCWKPCEAHCAPGPRASPLVCLIGCLGSFPVLTPRYSDPLLVPWHSDPIPLAWHDTDFMGEFSKALGYPHTHGQTE